MNKNIYKKLLSVKVLIIIVLLNFVIFFSFKKNLISRIILSHELSILPALIVREINKKTTFNVYDEKLKKKALVYFNNYLNSIFISKSGRYDEGATRRLLHGNVYCDGQSDALLRLLEQINVKAYNVFLYNNLNVSPHTLAFANIDNIEIKNDEQFTNEQTKLYLADTQNNYLAFDKRSQLMDISYMINNEKNFFNFKKLDSDGIKLNLLKNKKAEVFQENQILKEAGIVRKISMTVFRYLPTYITEKILILGINLSNSEYNYKLFQKSRLKHLLFKEQKAIQIFKRIPDDKFKKENVNYITKKIFFENPIGLSNAK